MEAAMVSASTGVMNSLLAKLGGLLEKEYGLLTNVEKDIAFLRDEMSSMNALLVRLAAADQQKLDAQTKEWRDTVRELAYDAEDCVDVYAHHLVRGSGGVARHLMALGARRDVAALYAGDASGLVAIDATRENIIRRLTAEDDDHQGGASAQQEQLRVVSIVGFGGVGKTTVANQVYAKIKDRFDCTAFVSVSRNPSTAKILEDILFGVKGYYHLLPTTSGSDDPHRELLDRLREYLKYRRYLLIIDDLWSVEAWDIIRVFGSEAACPEHLKMISENILAKCKGIPLAISSVARLLASQDLLKDKWEKIYSSLGFELERSPMMGWLRHVLDLGYNDLSTDLKTCMLYLAMFPEDYVIEKNDLTRRWIAEGFVYQRHGCDPEEIAERLSLRLRNAESSKVFSNINLSKTRSLSFWGPVQCNPVVSNFHLLRVVQLDMYSSRIYHESDDLEAISKLFQLRYLKIGAKLMWKMPKQIGALQNLETLEIDGHIYGDLPKDLCELPSLLHLIGSIKLPVGIGKLTTLRTLKVLNVDHKGSIESIKDLGKLTNLREIEIYYSEIQSDMADDMLSSFCKLGTCNLRSLVFLPSSGTDHRMSNFLTEPPRLVPRDMLRDWTPSPRHLHRLHVLSCPFSTIPEWIKQLDKLRSLEISVQVLSPDGINALGNLPSLLHLRLHVEDNVDGGIAVIHPAFGQLRKLWFNCRAPCLVFEQGAMPRLESLYVRFDADEAVTLLDGMVASVGHLSRLEVFWAQVYSSSAARVQYYREGGGRPKQFYSHPRAPFTKKSRMHMENAEAALRSAIQRHPANPSIIIDQD
uniref:NB-ARC domain-containing protein n=1 Tax=Leersia perrieri TaxID=77586 RepID=A0A0D9V083_9ORYZ